VPAKNPENRRPFIALFDRILMRMSSRPGSPPCAGTARDPEAVGWTWRTAAEPQQAARRDGLPLALKSLLVAGGAFTFLFGAGFIAFVATLDRSEREPNARADGIVALTGGAQRIGDAIDLLAKGYGSRLLITGVNERTSRDEIARLNPGQRRLVDCCVDLDHRARNTVGNAAETRRWAERNDFRSLIVVTSNYHMPRTLLELDTALPRAEKLPFPVVHEGTQAEDWWRNPGGAKLLASEYVKFLAVWLRTRLQPEPAPGPRGAPVRVANERRPG
jgi:uncharacterized SAM-binding protein YcdF (DUF218 family)